MWRMADIALIALFVLLLWMTFFLPAHAAEPQFYDGGVTKVIDGDSVEVKIDNWPAPFTPMQLRLDGIDTPESRSQDAKCEKELRLGVNAKACMRALLPIGTAVRVKWTGENEKYGRLLSVLFLGERNINQDLINKGFATEYHGDTKGSWCK